MTITLFLVLAGCAALLCIPLRMQMRWYGVKPLQSVFISLTIIVTGYIGSKLWFFLENGKWDGLSFFGAIYLSPFAFWLAAKWLRMEYLHALDFCATAGCFVLALLKIQCLMDGCCGGMILFLNDEHMYVRFPSQIVEFTTALILAGSMLALSYKEKNRKKIYPITLVSYGSLRFVLNLFRDDWDRAHEMGLFLPIGCIWAIMAVVIGAIWLVTDWRKQKNARQSYPSSVE